MLSNCLSRSCFFAGWEDEYGDGLCDAYRFVFCQTQTNSRSGQIVFDIDTAGSLSLAEQSQVMKYALRKKDRLFFVNPIVIDQSPQPRMRF